MKGDSSPPGIVAVFEEEANVSGTAHHDWENDRTRLY